MNSWTYLTEDTVIGTIGPIDYFPLNMRTSYMTCPVASIANQIRLEHFAVPNHMQLLKPKTMSLECSGFPHTDSLLFKAYIKLIPFVGFDKSIPYLLFPNKSSTDSLIPSICCRPTWNVIRKISNKCKFNYLFWPFINKSDEAPDLVLNLVHFTIPRLLQAINASCIKNLFQSVIFILYLTEHSSISKFKARATFPDSRV